MKNFFAGDKVKTLKSFDGIARDSVGKVISVAYQSIPTAKVRFEYSPKVYTILIVPFSILRRVL